MWFLLVFFNFQIVKGRANVTYTQYDTAITEVYNKACKEFANDELVRALASSEIKEYVASYSTYIGITIEL